MRKSIIILAIILVLPLSVDAARYKLTDSDNIQDTETGAFIPPDPGNRHYREYLEWLGEGNTPDPAHSNAELLELAKDKLRSDMQSYIGSHFDGETEALIREMISDKASYPVGVQTKLTEIVAWWKTVRQYFRDQYAILKTGTIPEYDFSTLDATVPTMPDGSAITYERVVEVAYPEE